MQNQKGTKWRFDSAQRPFDNLSTTANGRGVPTPNNATLFPYHVTA